MGKNFFDIIRVPLKFDTKSTVIIILTFIITAITPVIMLVANTNFINYSLEYFKGEATINTVSLYFGMIIFTMIIKNICGYISKKQNKVLECVLEEKITYEYANKKSNLKYELIEDEKILDLLNRVNITSIKNWSVNFNALLNLLLIIIQAIFISTIVFNINKILALMLVLIAVIYVITSIKTGEKEYGNIKEITNNKRKIEHFEKILTARDSVKERLIFGFDNFIRDKFDNVYIDTLRKQKPVTINHATKFTSINVGSGVFMGVVMLAFIPNLKDNTLSVGLYISLVNEINLFMDLVAWNVAKKVRELTKFSYYIKDVNKLFALEENINITNLIDIEEIKKIEFKNVTFSYPGSNSKVLDDFSLVMTQDKSYGIVGKNGCGKTTLTKLLMGLYSSYEGDILINDISIKNINKEKIFSVVFQDFVKYEMTIGEYLKLGNSQINESILKQLNIYDFIMNLTDKYNTKLGHLYNNGIDLSGGQWQKLAIARTLSKQSLIYILDEPSSALDPLVELAMYEMFYKSIGDKFSVFITHRLGITKLLDEIIFIDNGKVIAQDTHENLLKEDGLYTQMYNTQKEWYI